MGNVGFSPIPNMRFHMGSQTAEQGRIAVNDVALKNEKRWAAVIAFNVGKDYFHVYAPRLNSETSTTESLNERNL